MLHSHAPCDEGVIRSASRARTTLLILGCECADKNPNEADEQRRHLEIVSLSIKIAFAATYVQDILIGDSPNISKYLEILRVSFLMSLKSQFLLAHYLNRNTKFIIL